MRTLILFFILLLNISFLFAQNNAPEVTNVTFSQRTDGSFIVDVYYDLNDADGDTMSVIMLARYWSDDLTDGCSCDSITGDIGSNIISGNGKHIVWDFGSEHPETYGDQFRVKIIADDGKFETGTVTDIDGNVYKTVKIGDQWWMAENLRVIHYRDGGVVPWWVTSTYGCTYYWLATVDNRNIAPVGWHVPTDAEWQVLVDYLGGERIAGGKMKNTGTIEGGNGLWYAPNTDATNESGFSALPDGLRYEGYVYEVGYTTAWWSTTESIQTTHAYYRELQWDNGRVHRGGRIKDTGFSIRCVKD